MTYIEPALPLFLLVGIIGLVRLWRTSTPGKRPWLLLVSTVGIFLVSSHAFAWVVSRPLEIWYDAADPVPRGTAEAIVVLAGTVARPQPNRPYAYAGHDTYVRLQRGIWLFRHWKALPILVCGGSLRADEAPYAQTMAQMLEAAGIPPALIWSEARSRNTHENAVYGAEILRQHGISRVVLVVEASSMPRAAASFRKAGIVVVPAPIRFTGLHGTLADLLPGWQPIALNGETLHELVGLLWYKARGWI